MTSTSYDNKTLTLGATIAEAIFESTEPGDFGVSSGLLYAAVLSHYSLDEYNEALRLLEEAGWATIVNHAVTLTKRGRQAAEMRLKSQARARPNRCGTTHRAGVRNRRP